MHPDKVKMVEETITKRVDGIQGLVDTARAEDLFGMSEEELSSDKIRQHFSKIVDNFQEGDEIWQWNNIRPLSGARGYALFRGGKPIEMVVTNRS